MCETVELDQSEMVIMCEILELDQSDIDLHNLPTAKNIAFLREAMYLALPSLVFGCTPSRDQTCVGIDQKPLWLWNLMLGSSWHMLSKYLFT